MRRGAPGRGQFGLSPVTHSHHSCVCLGPEAEKASGTKVSGGPVGRAGLQFLPAASQQTDLQTEKTVSASRRGLPLLSSRSVTPPGNKTSIASESDFSEVLRLSFASESQWKGLQVAVSAAQGVLAGTWGVLHPQDGEGGPRPAPTSGQPPCRVQWLSGKERLINTKPVLISFWEP